MPLAAASRHARKRSLRGFWTHRPRRGGRRHARVRRREPLRGLGCVHRAAVARHSAQAHRAGFGRDGALRHPSPVEGACAASSPACTAVRPIGSASSRRRRISCAAGWSLRSGCPTSACRSPASPGSTCCRRATPEARRSAARAAIAEAVGSDRPDRPARAVRTDVARRRARPRRALGGGVADDRGCAGPPRRGAARALSPARGGGLRAAVPDRAGARDSAARWSRRHAAASRARRAGHGLLVARVRRRARSASRCLPRTRRGRVCAHARVLRLV